MSTKTVNVTSAFKGAVPHSENRRPEFQFFALEDSLSVREIVQNLPTEATGYLEGGRLVIGFKREWLNGNSPMAKTLKQALSLGEAVNGGPESSFA